MTKTPENCYREFLRSMSITDRREARKELWGGPISGEHPLCTQKSFIEDCYWNQKYGKAVVEKSPGSFPCLCGEALSPYALQYFEYLEHEGGLCVVKTSISNSMRGAEP